MVICVGLKHAADGTQKDDIFKRVLASSETKGQNKTRDATATLGAFVLPGFIMGINALGLRGRLLGGTTQTRESKSGLKASATPPESSIFPSCQKH